MCVHTSTLNKCQEKKKNRCCRIVFRNVEGFKQTIQMENVLKKKRKKKLK